MAVLTTCKFDEDPIKIKGTIDRTRSNKGLTTLKRKKLLIEYSDLAEILTHPRI